MNKFANHLLNTEPLRVLQTNANQDEFAIWPSRNNSIFPWKERFEKHHW